MATLRNDVLLLGAAGNSGRLIAAEVFGGGEGQGGGPGVPLVRGGGWGRAGTETRVGGLVGKGGGVPALVGVAAAAGVTRHSDGVRQTIQESLSQGVAITYRDDQ